MKNKQLIAIIIAGIVIFAGIFVLITMTNSDNTTSQTQNSATEDTNIADQQNKDQVKEQETSSNPSNAESYITLEEYQANTDVYQSNKLVYFFHASWCPICVSIDKDINQDPSQIPSGVTFIKTDFDSSTDLRKKYGVTNQYTFVQVDKNGNEVKQWTSSNLDSSISNIKL